MKIKLQFIIAAFIALAIYIPAAYGQANLVFSGGNGAPMSITLQQSVTYTINNTQCTTVNGPLFVFDETGDAFLNSVRNVTGTITFSINGGAPQSITRTNSGVTSGDISANDTYMFGFVSSVQNGSTVVLSAGTITTTTNVAAPPPTSGSFTTFITNAFGSRCSTNGAVAPVTSAPISIEGRVLTTKGTGLANAQVVLTDSDGTVRYARTLVGGYYRFSGIPSANTVVISVVSKKYNYSPQVLTLTGDAAAVDFTATGRKSER